MRALPGDPLVLLFGLSRRSLVFLRSVYSHMCLNAPRMTIVKCSADDRRATWSGWNHPGAGPGVLWHI